MKKIIWFGLGGLLLVGKCLGKASRVAFSADMFLKIKTVCLLDVIPEMLSFYMRPFKYFYDKPLPKYIDSKNVLIYRPHPVHLWGTGGEGGSMVLDRSRAFDLFASVDAHLWCARLLLSLFLLFTVLCLI